MTRYQNGRRILGAVAASTLALTIMAGPASADWQPERNVEFIAMYGPGGGHDIMMRATSQMMIEEGITSATIQVRNLPGGSGARAMEYLHQQDGDGHYLSAATATFITTPLRGGTELQPSDFTPIALLAQDPAVILVNVNSDLETIQDVISAASERTLNFGGTGIGGQGHLVALQLGSEAGVEFNYIPYDGDGDLAAALMGNQLDIISANFNTAFDFIQAGEFRAVAISAYEGMEDLANVPTLVEAGYDVVVTLPRAVIGPPNMPEEAREYWVNAFRELTETDRWREEYIERYNVQPGNLFGEEFAAFIAESEEFYRTTLTEAGLLQ
jgi:putative tricarboxylic transport membrane protein